MFRRGRPIGQCAPVFAIWQLTAPIRCWADRVVPAWGRRFLCPNNARTTKQEVPGHGRLLRRSGAAGLAASARCPARPSPRQQAARMAHEGGIVASPPLPAAFNLHTDRRTHRTTSTQLCMAIQRFLHCMVSIWSNLGRFVPWGKGVHGDGTQIAG